MTLDEAIIHAEEVADIKLQDAELSEIQGCYNNAKKCSACAKEHRQLAEWLKELKQLREQTRWIPVSERLPEEKINPITEDFYEYQCTYYAYGIYDVRSYKFGDGHWWHGPGIMDDSVIAWRPLPEPYVPDNNVGEKEKE